MIVKVSDSLRELFCNDVQRPVEPEEPWRPVVMDIGGPRRLAIPTRHDDGRLPEDIKDLVPEWMGEALLEGNMLVMPTEDYVSLDEQVKEHLEVISF